MTRSQEPTLLSPYEKGDTRVTQWRTDNGPYCGYSIAAPTDESHPLRGTWELTPALNTMRYTSDRHIMTVGPNGSGKTRRLLFPNLYYLKNWSIVAIDPKGELFAHTAVERAKTAGHRIVLIDPFAVVKTNYPRLAERISCDSIGFNPIAALDPHSLRFIDDAKSLAVSLIQTEDTRDKYWPLAAQALIKGLVMGLRIRGGPEASLVDLRDVLGLPPALLAGYISRMIERLGEDWPAISASLGEFANYSADDGELGGIRRTAKVQTDWLDSPQIRTDLEADAFDFSTLKEHRRRYILPCRRNSWLPTGSGCA
jgi:type IV secretion system protein VirD4